MKWLSTYKDQVSSIGSIATAVGVVTALFFSTYSLILKPNKPALDLLSTKISKNEERLVIYNGGSGPCVELTIEYPDQFEEVSQIVNYEISWHTNKEYKNGKFQFPARIFDSFQKEYICQSGRCKIDAGYLAPNKVFPLHFKLNKGRNIEVSASCIGESESIALFE